jgi:multicomponent Na+:H+ antiporter subunit C
VTVYLIAAIFIIGLWGVISLPNLIRKVVALSFMNSAIILFFVHLASRTGTRAPILSTETEEVLRTGTTSVADPVPQALMLTAIVVGICVVAVALVLVYRLYRRYGTLDIRELEEKIWSSAAEEGHDGSGH